MLPLPADKAINLYQNLLEARRLKLHPALSAAVAAVGVVRIDPELARLVPLPALNHLAALGLRGERVFPVPAIISYSPHLIGYYRMLLGLSRLKDFSTKYHYTAWAAAEESGLLPPRLQPQVESFCRQLIDPLVLLVAAMDQFDDRDLNDLALLTLGPTLQGQRNNAIGREAATQVFMNTISLIDPAWITFRTANLLARFATPHGQIYELIAGSDPDVRLHRGVGSTADPLLAIEIKGGGDLSNAHNRAGEAEKSQLKAKQAGYPQRWTIIQRGGLARSILARETPSSTEIFEFTQVVNQADPDWQRFRSLFLALLEISP